MRQVRRAVLQKDPKDLKDQKDKRDEVDAVDGVDGGDRVGRKAATRVLLGFREFEMRPKERTEEFFFRVFRGKRG